MPEFILIIALVVANLWLIVRAIMADRDIHRLQSKLTLVQRLGSKNSRLAIKLSNDLVRLKRDLHLPDDKDASEDFVWTPNAVTPNAEPEAE